MAKTQQEKERRQRAGRTDDADALVRISVILSKDERHRLKVFAAERGTTISELVRDGIARLLLGGRTP